MLIFCRVNAGEQTNRETLSAFWGKEGKEERWGVGGFLFGTPVVSLSGRQFLPGARKRKTRPEKSGQKKNKRKKRSEKFRTKFYYYQATSVRGGEEDPAWWVTTCTLVTEWKLGQANAPPTGEQWA